jgi:hypothetical protein
VRGTAVVQWTIIILIAAGLGYAVVHTAHNWASWVVFGAIVCAAIGGGIAVWHRQYPAATKKRAFTRDSESKW